MHRPEGFFGERRRAQPILIAHHNEAEVEMLAYETEVLEYTFHERQLLERVYLLIFRLFDQCAIAVYDQSFLLDYICSFSSSFMLSASTFCLFRAFSRASMEPYM